MSTFIHKVQALGNKAAQIKAAIESVPPRVLEVREAVAATATQFQQLRSEVQSNVTALRMNREEELVEALREIDARSAAFREAGYELHDVEMELGIPQRLIVHLEKIEDVVHSKIGMLAGDNVANKTVHAILTALLKAEELADDIALTHLTYHKLTVYVGPVPVVRLCWCAPAQTLGVSTHAEAPSIGSPTSMTPSASLFGTESFFEKRPESPLTSPLTAATYASPKSIELPLVQPADVTPVTASMEREDPLARFKKMPDLSKRYRESGRT